MTLRDAAVQTFHETMASTLLIFVSFFVVFACTLAFGVTYNAARIALSERGRELATLRVLGFTRAEISYILLGETGVLALVALPLGVAFGYLLATPARARLRDRTVPHALRDHAGHLWLGNSRRHRRDRRIALLVRRRLDRLDLIAVLKTRE